MQKRVFIIHGWDGSPNEPALQWLKASLEKKGLEVVIPEMPDPGTPTISSWVGKLASSIGQPDKETILVGHSIGCQTILRYLESLHPISRVGGVVFIAPWLTLSNLSKEEQEVARPWIETEIRETDVIKHVDTSQIVAFFSDNDPFVPIENIKLFKDRFGAKTILLNGKGHFTEEDSVSEPPQIFDAIVKIASSVG